MNEGRERESRARQTARLGTRERAPIAGKAPIALSEPPALCRYLPDISSTSINTKPPAENAIVFPVAYFLMKRKTEEAYWRILVYVRQLITWDITTVITDYEIALINSMRAIFPNARLQG
ncbi:hypothetical protein LSTR_LSTR004530 [Laodelphax striatellus]|uniref:Uncharacterized protein n=1 Tax=Laodelphax striatellus TaxID=195883 RepID=A0A482WU84_LAOST|nr:hypothetical protein LSTR_LSTR004530 [Laodelphax striatellus]